MISKANFELLLREGRSFEEYFRFEEEDAVEQKEEEVLGDDAPEEAIEQSENVNEELPAEAEEQEEIEEGLEKAE